jgi:SAM-dependent methyltransferase
MLTGLLSPATRLRSVEKVYAYFAARENLEAYLDLAPDLPDAALETARLFSSRHKMLEALPKGGTVCEVGTWRGEFTRVIALTCEPVEFHLIDIDFSPLGEIPIPVQKHEGDSADMLSNFPPAYFDWIYVDADHSYASVKRDLAAAHRALKPGGYLMCNDYAIQCLGTPYGVAKALNEMVIEMGYTVEGLALDRGCMFDMLIKRPHAAHIVAG